MKRVKIIQIIISFLLVLLILYTNCELYTTSVSKEEEEESTSSTSTYTPFTIDFTEDFDTTSLDQIPDEFYTEYEGTDLYVGVVDNTTDSNITPHSLPNCLKISDNSDTEAAQILRNIGNQYYGQLTFSLYVDDTSPWFGTFIANIIQLFFNSSRDITVTLQDETLQIIGTYTTNTWHKVTIKWDAYTYKYKVFFNDIDLGTYIFKVDNIPSIIGLAATQGINTGHLNYIDDVTFTTNPETIN